MAAPSTICFAYILKRQRVHLARLFRPACAYFCAPAAMTLSAQMVASAGPSDGSSLNDLLRIHTQASVCPPGTAVSPGVCLFMCSCGNGIERTNGCLCWSVRWQLSQRTTICWHTHSTLKRQRVRLARLFHPGRVVISVLLRQLALSAQMVTSAGPSDTAVWRTHTQVTACPRRKSTAVSPRRGLMIDIVFRRRDLYGYAHPAARRGSSRPNNDPTL
jgi:hypothetical protein